MKTYEIEFSEKELEIFKEATELGLSILSFDIDTMSKVFDDKTESKELLGKIKETVFGDKTPEEITYDFNKETRIRYHSLKSLSKKLENV